MSFKLVFPTYRARFLWVEGALSKLPSKPRRLLNVGCGEGDYERALAAHATEVFACDLNADDVAHARALNADLPSVHYSVQDGTALAFPDAHFDAVTCLEVIEHVRDPAGLVHELARVVAPGGHVLLTCPSADFPVTYDPIHRALAPLGLQLGGFGAYAYGHTWLVEPRAVTGWIRDAGLTIASEARLTGPLAAASECYWPGLLQKALKANSGNTGGPAKRFAIKPQKDPPALVRLTDLLVRADEQLRTARSGSVGLAYLLRKPPSRP